MEPSEGRLRGWNHALTDYVREWLEFRRLSRGDIHLTFRAAFTIHSSSVTFND